MANDKEYFSEILGTPHGMRIRLTTDHGQVIAFTVQFEAWIDGAHRPVIRFDTQHDRPHRDILGWDQKTVHKNWGWLGDEFTRAEAFTLAQREVRDHWEREIAAFLRRKP